MKRTAATILALATLSFPAHALTLDQAYSEMGGYHIGSDGKTGTKKTPGTATVENPDVVEHRSNPNHNTGPLGSTATYAGCTTMTMDHHRIPKIDVTADCVPLTMSPAVGATSYTVVTDGGVSIVVTCSTSTKVLNWNGPFTDRAHAWSVDSSVSTSKGAC